MKSALIVTGNIRTFERCADTFEKICNKFNPDIFICMSNVEFALNEYIREKYMFERDNLLTLEQLKYKFKLVPTFSEKIKSIQLINKSEEDVYIQQNYLGLFDVKKDWQGMDIFKQYHKKKLCIEEAKKYETCNNITYDYVLQMRFDINVDILTLPNYPLQHNSLYGNISNNLSSIDDICICCDKTDTLKSIYDQVIELFINNTDNPNICKSIHTMLGYACKNINMINQNIGCEFNREYKEIFDTNVTLVTAFFDIGRKNWNVCQRDNSVYFINCEKVLKQKNPIIIFTTEEYKDKCEEIRRKTDKNMMYTKFFIIPFENLRYYEYRDLIRSIQDKNNLIQGVHNADYVKEPEYTKPDYVILINNKINFMKQVSDMNPYNSQFFQWIDFGIHPNMLRNDCDFDIFGKIIYKPGKYRIAGFYPVKNFDNRSEHYNIHKPTLSAALMGGDKKSIEHISTLFDREFNTMLTEGFINQEQYILYYLISKQPEAFDYHCAHSFNWDFTGDTYLNHNSLKVALCMSGHMRSYQNCRQNIIDNIINPLKQMGFSTYLFLSSWEDIGYGADSLITGKVDLQNYDLNDFTQYEFEPANKDFFDKNFSTDKYLNYSQYSGAGTCPNAVQMLYKMERVYTMADNYSIKNNINYDLVIRIRPDIIYNNRLCINDIKQSLYRNNDLFMPYHHGKYEIVTKYIMDHYFMGDNRVMKEIMLAYNNIQNLMKEDCPHTCEGFIWKQIEMQNLKIELFNLKYSVIRKNNIVENVIR